MRPTKGRDGMGERYYAVKGTIKLKELDLDELTRRGSSITLTVESGDGKVGTLIIGRGSITWKHRKQVRTMHWWEFHERMMRKDRRSRD